MRRLVKEMERAGIVHAIIGGLAVYAHGHRRLTVDVDILLTADGLEAFKRGIVPKGYDPVPNRPRRFVDRKNGVTIDVLVTGRFPGSGRPGPIAFPDPSSVRERIENHYYVNLATLIQLKLAARRWKDFADVVDLIQANNLDESFLDRVHTSVQQDFIECLEEMRREDEYEARQ
jgi:hypothetical protein